MRKINKLILLLFLPLLLISCDRKPVLSYKDACAHPDALKEIKYYVKHKIADAEGLLIAAEKNTNEKIVKELLKSKNIDSDAKNEALLKSLNNKNPDILKTLLKAGADVNARDDMGMTPLMIACINGNKTLVDALITAKADVNAVVTFVENGVTCKVPILMLALGFFTEKPDVDMVMGIVNSLITAGADVDAEAVMGGESVTALAAVWELGNKDIIDTLLKAGADINKVYETYGIRMVTIPGKDFEMMTTEVTQKSYKYIIGKNPSKFKGDNNPVERVSWYDAIEFCNVLSKKFNLVPVYILNGENVTKSDSADGFRLPTRAEWEYAAKGGENYNYSGSNNINDVAWYCDNSGKKTHPVGQKKANGYGLYDMSGNVWEWCWDWDELEELSIKMGPHIKGGGYLDVASETDGFLFPKDRQLDTGFRVVRNIK